MLFDSSKRKNDDKRKRLPRRRALFAVFIASLMLFPVVVFMLESRFTPMTDVPTADLVYAEGGERYVVDFQTGSRALASEADLLAVGTPQKLSISPDGRWFVKFEWLADEEKSVLSLVDLTSQQPPRLLGKFSLFSYSHNGHSWSSDQKWVIFSAYNYYSPLPPGQRHSSRSSEIWMIHVPTGELRRLTTNTYRDESPIFSPDGTRIAYISAAERSSGLYIMDLATGESRLLTSDQNVVKLVWSPDSQWIAYHVGVRVPINAMDFKNLYNLYVIRIDGLHMQAVIVGENSGSIIGWKQ